MAVSVEPLVLARVVAKVGAGPLGDDGAFGHSRDGWSVVAAVQERGVSDVEVVGHEADLSEQGGMFEVAVGHRPVWVVD